MTTADKTADKTMAPATSCYKDSADAAPAYDSANGPTYDVLRRAGLLSTQWFKPSVDDLELRAGNSTPGRNLLLRLAGVFFPPAWCMLRTKEVPAGSVVKMRDGKGGFEFLGNRGPQQGVHCYWDMFYSIDSHKCALNGSESGLVITHGDRWIVVVPEGFIGLASDCGRPILLPPGMHQWKSHTMKYERCIDLNTPVIEMGPYTLLTVDRGYEAVTTNNGEQRVMPGGAVHLLDHRQWRFEKFIPTKIQTDDLQRIEVMTGDNVLMHVDATVCWQISDVQMCAERAADTMATSLTADGKRDVAGAGRKATVDKLRFDVLKQAEASLSALVGKVHFSNTFSAAAAVQVGQVPAAAAAGGVNGLKNGMLNGATSIKHADLGGADGMSELNLLFDLDKLTDAVKHANAMCGRYGVEVLSINIIGARPADAALREALATGAVAAAMAQQREIDARGGAKAKTIDAQGYADALQISAAADAAADVTRAEGSQKAAALLNAEAVAVQLATIQATGAALASAGSSLILGGEPSGMGSMLLANPNVVSKKMIAGAAA